MNRFLRKISGIFMVFICDLGALAYATESVADRRVYYLGSIKLQSDAWVQYNNAALVRFSVEMAPNTVNGFHDCRKPVLEAVATNPRKNFDELRSDEAQLNFHPRCLRCEEQSGYAVKISGTILGNELKGLPSHKDMVMQETQERQELFGLSLPAGAEGSLEFQIESGTCD